MSSAIARAHSEVVGEALKNAKIDIVGGENDFFEKIVRAVGNGNPWTASLPTARRCPTSRTQFFNGDPDFFKSQLCAMGEGFRHQN
jgi:hypothetical protein